VSMEPDVPAHPHSSPKERSNNSDRQGAIERYYELLGSGHSVGGKWNTVEPIRSKSEHGGRAPAEPLQSGIKGTATDISAEVALVGLRPEKVEGTRSLAIPLSYGMESYRTEEPPAAASASLSGPGSDDRKQLLRESLPGSKPDTDRSAGAHTPVGHEEVIRSGDQKKLRFSRFPRRRKRIAFGALYTVIAVSVSIAGFSIMRGGRDPEPTTTRAQSGISGRTEATAMSGQAADRSEAVVELQKPSKQVGNADTSQVPHSLRPAEPDLEVPGILQKPTAEVRGKGSTAQQEARAPQRSNAGQVDAIQQSIDSATAPRDLAHEPTSSVAQSLSVTPKGSAETAPRLDTGEPVEAPPKDETKATGIAPTTNVSATLPSRMHTAERRRASTPRRDSGSRWRIHRRTPAKYP
jgi:hypothetical protein